MKRRTIAAAAAVAAALTIGGGAVALAGNGADDQPDVTGPAADQAKAAALAATGGGTANAVERDDENRATWEVEVTKPGGDTVDVRLDADYRVVVIEGDDEVADTGSED